MEAAVKVALPASVKSARLMGSVDGLGSGGVLVGEVRWHTEGACSSGGRKDSSHAVNVSAPACWAKIHDSEGRIDVCHPSRLYSDDAVNDSDYRNMNSHPPTPDLDAKSVLQKSGKIVRKNSGCTKRSGMVHMEISKDKSGLRDVNETFPELASSSASCNLSEKNQLVKQKLTMTSRRGDKRSSKANYKSRCDSFSLKNGLAGFNSAAGGNNFIGIWGLKSDVFDITKYVDEPSLDELLRGSYSCPSRKGKTTTNSNSNLLQSVRNACSILQSQKVSHAQNSAETDNSFIRKDSTGLVTVSSAVRQTDGSKGDGCPADVPSLENVHESVDKIKMSDIHGFPLCKPKEFLGRLILSPLRDLDMLLSDATKTTSSSKNNADARLSKPISQRVGLPPFPWSHSFTGHNKLGSDAVKLSSSRTICQGQWIKVKNCIALQKGSADLLKDYESLTFDQRLVPSISDRPENESAPVERVLCGASSPSEAPTDEYSTIHAAAQTLLDMAACSKQYPCALVMLLKKPSQVVMEASNSKATERSDFFFQEPKSTVRPHSPLKVGGDGFSSKKPKLSSDVTNTYITHTEPMRKGALDPFSLLSARSPPRKLFRDPNANTDSYGVNLVKKSCVIRTPRGTDRPSSSKPKFWKSSQ